MEKTKLLRLLITGLIYFSAFLHCSSYASDSGTNACELNMSDMENLLANDDDNSWITDFTDQAKQAALSGIKAKFRELKEQQGQEAQIEQFTNPPVTLRVFVSQSMSLHLLRHYYQEARKYGGVLVFKGLPQDAERNGEGSFKALAQLVQSIAEDGEAGSMQIDDEAFKRFNINSVPTIVLSKENDDDSAGGLAIDKIIGNVGVRFALTEFAKTGDLAERAEELLQP